MPDWLEELREEKKQAIARTQGTRNAGMQYASVADRLQAEQRQLAALVQSIGIEPLLQQFVDEVLRDHPLFVDSTLNRTVIGRDSNESPAREEKEGAPWSGPIEGNFLPPALDLGGGRTVSRVDWRLHLNYRQQYSEQLQLNDILITVSAQGVQVNNEPLAEPAAETFKTALVSAFRNSTQPSLPPGVRRATGANGIQLLKRTKFSCSVGLSRPGNSRSSSSRGGKPAPHSGQTPYLRLSSTS